MMHVNVAKIFIILISFLGIFAIIVQTIPAGFFLGTSNFRGISVPPYFEAIDLTQYAGYYCINITSTPTFTKDWGKEDFGHNMLFGAMVTTDHWMDNQHYFLWWIFGTGYHQMEWINKNGLTRGHSLTDGEIDLDSDNGTAPYTVQCSHFQMSAWVGYNSSLYDSSTEAWDAHELSVLFAINWDEKGTTMNTWNLVAMLLFFQLPEINPIINMIIAIPLWVCFSILAAILIMEVIRTLKPFG